MKKYDDRDPIDQHTKYDECEKPRASEAAARERSEEGETERKSPSRIGYAVALFDGTRVPALVDEKDKLRQLAVSPGLQALWGALLPMVGVRPAKPEEYAGVFKIEPGPSDSEATIYIDVPSRPYERGKNAPMERVVTLNVKLAHDYRLLGDQYYCVDCEAPTTETRH